MPQFQHIENLGWLWLVLLGAATLWLYIRWRKNALAKLVDASLQPLVLQKNTGRSKVLSAVCMLAALTLLLFSLANLQIGKKPQKMKRAGLDMVIALDISRSMDAEDLKPSRLAQAKHLVQQLFNMLPQDRIGLVVFAGNAYIQLPLTTDLQAAAMFLNTINTDMAPTQGTSIGDAITQSITLLYPKSAQKETNNSAKVILLLSDGENHESGAKKIAEEAQKQGAIIYTIGVGSNPGAPIPISQNGGTTLLEDENGQTVISKLNQEMLRELANASGGKYFQLNNDANTAKNLAAELGKLKRGEKEVMVFDEYESYFQLFAAAAMLLLLLEPFGYIFGKRKRETAE